MVSPQKLANGPPPCYGEIAMYHVSELQLTTDCYFKIASKNAMCNYKGGYQLKNDLLSIRYHQ